MKDDNNNHFTKLLVTRLGHHIRGGLHQRHSQGDVTDHSRQHRPGVRHRYQIILSKVDMTVMMSPQVLVITPCPTARCAATSRALTAARVTQAALWWSRRTEGEL